MIRKFYLALLCGIGFLIANAQTPQGINYQGVARNNLGQPIVNQGISVGIIVYDSTAVGAVVLYDEQHQTTTNAMGLFNLVIGNGSATFGRFDTIQWAKGKVWCKISIDPSGGSSPTIIGRMQLFSVPYALHAATTDQPGPKGDSGVKGEKGDTGAVGIGIKSVRIVKDSLIVAYTDGGLSNAGFLGSSNGDFLYLRPEQFGAKPNDPQFDNSTAIQNAADSAIACGKTLLFSKGDYYVANTIYIRKKLQKDHEQGPQWKGMGVGHSKIVSTTTNALIVIENALSGTGTPIPGYFFTGGGISNLAFQNLLSSGNGHCLSITGWWYGLLDNVQIRNYTGNAINMPIRNNFGPPFDANGNAYTDNYSSFISIKNSWLTNNNGWAYFDERDNTSSDLQMDKVIVASNAKGGIRFGGQSLKITGCAIAYNGYGAANGGGLELGVRGNSSHNNFITQTEFDGNNTYHIKMNAVMNTVVTQNRFLFHDQIDSARMCPSNGGILLAADSLYPLAANCDFTKNYIRVDMPTKAKQNRQQLYWMRFLAHGATGNLTSEHNFFQALPSGFSVYHDFTPYDYYFNSRLGIANNIKINDPFFENKVASTTSKPVFYADGQLTNQQIDTGFGKVQLHFPITYGSQNILNLPEFVAAYDSTSNEFSFPVSGYYEVSTSFSINANGIATKLFLQYSLGGVITETHQQPLCANGICQVQDRWIVYGYAGQKMSVAMRANDQVSLSSSQKSSLFIRAL